MAGEEAYTPREMTRALVRLEQSITELRQEVSTLGFVRQDVWSVEREAMHERIEQVRLVAESSTKEVADKADAATRVVAENLGRTQENLTWLVRAVVGVVLTVVIGGLLVAAGVGP